VSNAATTYVPSMLVIFRQLRPDSGVGFEIARKVFDTPSPPQELYQAGFSCFKIRD
jgi:hypothetical protein